MPFRKRNARALKKGTLCRDLAAFDGPTGLNIGRSAIEVDARGSLIDREFDAASAPNFGSTENAVGPFAQFFIVKLLFVTGVTDFTGDVIRLAAGFDRALAFARRLHRGA